MKHVRIGAAILNQTPLDWVGNRDRIVGALNQARADGVSVLCLPELCISGYGCEDAFLGAHTHLTAQRMLQEILPATKGMIVSLGLPLFHDGALFNAVCLVVDGNPIGFVAKQFLAGDGLHYEPRWFKPWPKEVQTSIRLFDGEYPIGPLIFNCGGLKIGFEICEDAWVAKRPGGNLALQGVDLILNPSASHFAFGKHEVRKRFVLEGSRAFGVTYAYANLVGNESGRAIYDGGVLIASAGKLIARGPRFSYLPYHVTSSVVNIDSVRMSRAGMGSYQPELKGRESPDLHVPFTFPDIEPDPTECKPPPWELGSHLKKEEFTRAISLGLFDYLRKSRSCGFVVSLSGGADSAAVSCLVALMVEAACQELEAKAFHKALNHIPGLTDQADTASRIRHLLHCVYQGTDHSSEATRNAARALANALGAEMSMLEVGGLVSEYVSSIEKLVGRTLTWKDDDIALQNIQARVRGPGVWMLANLKKALLLATSNRSEAAVGYATMDGDTCGGLSPIAGIDKAFLLEWLKWLETDGPENLHPIPALASVNALTPTAELRPLAAEQSDEKDLMPYPILDAVERAAIRDKLAPVEVFRLMRATYPKIDAEQLKLWIKRFFRLWSRNQWKRERYAPSFHVDDENLDPKTWCRFPILSGGFEMELAELDGIR